ncbi:MAG: SDR family oxidoreductase [Deltaproteobacteria bacterium]|nr:SDR family oxidoreductase [Deltaproteobacteria bacterium]
MSSFEAAKPTSVLITGSGGYLGRQVVANLAADPGSLERIVAMDLRPEPEESRLPGVTYLTADVRDRSLPRIIEGEKPQVVVHLAALVTPGKKSDRRLEYEVDVMGTEHVLEGCVEAGAQKLIYSSSGAAYGYHADNPPWLSEDDALRGNKEFAYSDHKRQVEEMLARWRHDYPELEQLILRPGVILGEGTANQITALFDKPLLLGVAGSETPFTIIWDQDAVGVIRQGIFSTATGIYNLSGDGAITMREIAGILGKTYLPLPAGLLRGALWVLKRLGLTQYGPEQVGFLQYRPVLDNTRLKEVMGYIPANTSREAFEHYLAWRDGRGQA